MTKFETCLTCKVLNWQLLENITINKWEKQKEKLLNRIDLKNYFSNQMNIEIWKIVKEK
jgi:hypothetical protein